ncbi:hypothetical protein [Halopiger goleimassiliensis]|uniref:hypothetical protein n=1 Tax=Halopiger goleimassiliensis TaxID=1293048 RepID=UPI000677E5EC|nr:hypothetical protein [Halopiger goleimassiliensis]
MAVSITGSRIVAALVALLVVPALVSPVAAAGTGATFAQADTQQQTDFQLELRAEADAPEGTAQVSLLATGENVAGYEANVSFDPSVVQFANASGEDLPDPVTNSDAEDGWVYLTSSHQDGHDDPTLAVLEFDVVGEADDEAELRFIEEDTLVNTEALTVYEADDGDVGTEATTLEITEAGVEAQGATAAGDGNDADDDGLSMLTVALATFAAGVVLTGVIAGTFVYGKRRGKRSR